MSAAIILALIIVGWNVISPLWEWLDTPVTRTYHSNFYLAIQVLIAIAMLVLALVILI